MSSYDRSARAGLAPVVASDARQTSAMLQWLTRLGTEHPVRAIALGTAVALVYSFALTFLGALAFTGWNRDLGLGETLVLGATIPLLVAPPMLAGVLRLLRRLDRLSDALRIAAETDPLTSVHNRRGFFERAGDDEFAGHAVYMVDLDDFKRLNDTFGHDLGDRVLQEVAEWLTVAIGEGALVGRLGGDEFACVTRHLDTSIGDRRHHFDMQGVTYSISIGATIVGSTETVSEALMRADSALYRVKTAPAPEHSR